MLYPLSYEGLYGVSVTRSQFDGQVDGQAGGLAQILADSGGPFES